MKDYTKLVGKKVIITTSDGGHAVPIGTKTTIINAYNADNFRCAVSPSMTFYRRNFKVIGTTKEEIKEGLKEALEQAEVLKVKLACIEDLGIEEVDDDTLKAHTIVKTLEDKKLSKAEKTKKIAKLIKQ